MWTYIARRLLLMIPTLFGVTIISFVIMQIAPGDPVRGQMSTQGTASASAREAYLVRKRDLKLDKPLVLNFRNFEDYGPDMRIAAHFMGSTPQEIGKELDRMAGEDAEVATTKEKVDAELDRKTKGGGDAKLSARLAFLRKNYEALLYVKPKDFDDRLKKQELRERMVQTVPLVAQIYCENAGPHGVPPLEDILRSEDSSLELKIGALRCLPHMVLDPFPYTYSRKPTADETPLVQAVWRTWWERADQAEFPEPAAARRAELERDLQAMADQMPLSELFDRLNKLHREDARFFLDQLLAEDTPLAERAVSAQALLIWVGKRLKVDVPLDADAAAVQQVSANWLAVLEPRQSRYQPSLPAKLWYVVGDTQYAHTVWRLVTFNFGRSAVKTREPVGPRIWEAVKVSAPLMVLAQIVIYLVAVPLGIVCAVNRGKFLDRLISLGLFLLYSIPPFVAGMLLLLFFCYGDYLKLFPMLGLHSPGAEQMTFGAWLADYLWHAFLPVVCLSLFSLAAMAMYSRSSMLDVINQDFIRTARAKGVPERGVIWHHALRNALIPIITLFANFLPAMLGGSVLIEYIFGIPGMGRLSFDSINQQDFPMLMALIYIDAIVVMLSILLSDLLYVVADPRISFGAQGGAA